MAAILAAITGTVSVTLDGADAQTVGSFSIPTDITIDRATGNATLHAASGDDIRTAMATALREAADELLSAIPAAIVEPARFTMTDLAARVLILVAQRPAAILITGHSADEAVRRLNELARHLPAELVQSVSSLNGAEMISLMDGTMIRARSQRSRGAVRGYVYDLIVIDEHTSRDFIAEARPAMATRNGEFVFLDLGREPIPGEGTVATCRDCGQQLGVQDGTTTLEHAADGSHVAAQRY